ncbi:hypothetical protein L208DRAFT_1018046, partial [Tricholoma matsutake]
VHDDLVVGSLHGTAIWMMAEQGVVIEKDEEQMALQIFPHVAGLACRVHDSSTLREKFDRLVQEDTELEGSMKMLTR